MGKQGIISVVIIVVVIAGGALLLRSGDDSETASTTNNGDTASSGSTTDFEEFDSVPQFALEDIDGNEVTPNDFPGKILVVNSWATWCPFCVNELLDFIELQAAFPDEIVVIAIDRAESRKLSVGYTDDLDVTDSLIWLLDPADSFYRSIGGFSMPETLFVDADGNIRLHKRGPMDINEMTKRIESLL